MNRLFREHTRLFEFHFYVIHHVLFFFNLTISLSAFKSLMEVMEGIVLFLSFQITQNFEIIRTKDAIVRSV